MRSSIATVVSIVGVAVTSVAAYSFNTVILSSSDGVVSVADSTVTEVQSSPVSSPGNVTQATVGTSVAGVTGAEASLPFVTSVETSPTLVPRTLARQDQTVTYDLGRLGTITVRESADVVSLVTAQSAWRVASTSQGKQTSVRFSNAAEEYVFVIYSALGSLTTTLTETTPARQTPSTVPRQRDTERDDDDDDDEYEEHGSGEEDDEDEERDD